jgi:hypothetical protein
MNRTNVLRHLLVVSGVGLATALAPSTASAQERYQDRSTSWRDEPSAYPLEVEPHFTFGAENVYGQTGFGAGVRLGIPIVYDLLHRVPDNIAIGFGGDIVHYDNCYFPGRCGANYFMFPVVAQWNVFLLRRLSVFAEAGVYVYKGFFDTCTTADGFACSAPPDFGVLPTLAVGARLHLGDNVSFTARIGYPTITFGLSFL